MLSGGILSQTVTIRILADHHQTESSVKLRRELVHRIYRIADKCGDGAHPCVGSCQIQIPGKENHGGIIELPFALPTAVAGIALTHLTVQNGWVGRIFARFGIDIAYTRIGITIALVFIGIPFVVRSVQPVLEKVDREYEEAAAMFGASRIQIFFRVILPEILPALIAGFTMAFARSLGEYGSVVFIAGNTPYETEITPLLIMSELQEYDYASETSIALVMLAIAFVILLVNAFIQSRTSRIVSGID